MPTNKLLDKPEIERKESPSDRGEGWRTTGILIFGLVLSIAAEPLSAWLRTSLTWEPGQKAMAAIGYGLEHLGVVLVVAMLIRVAIEKGSQRQFVNLVNTKVREQVELSIQQIATNSLVPVQQSIRKIDEEFGFRITRPGLLDDQSRKELKEKVLSPKFIRSDYTLYLTLEPLPAQQHREGSAPLEKVLRVRSQITYRVTNITDEPADYAIKAWIDRMFEPADIAKEDSGQFTRLICGPETLKGDTQLRPYDIPKLVEQKKIVHDENAVWLDYDLQSGIPPQTTYYVEIVGTQILRFSDLFVWNMGALTNRLTVSVELSGGFTNLDFVVNARGLHHIPAKDFLGTFNQTGNVFSWKIDQVLLPYQGVEIWWMPPPPSKKPPAEEPKPPKNSEPAVPESPKA